MNCVRILACVPIVTVMLVAPGCGKVKGLAGKAKAAAAKGAASVQKSVTETVESASTDVQEELQLAGKINLTMDAPVETKACYARLILQGEKRKPVFELRSYSAPDQEEFPSVFFHSQISANNAQEMAGKIVSGRLFVQLTADGPVWSNPTGSPVELQISGIQDNLLSAEIVSASLQNAQTGAVKQATGSFSALQQ